MDNLKDGVIFLQHNQKWGKWYENLITWLITKMPVKGPYIHTQIYLRGWVYEYTINGNSVARKRTRVSGAGTDNKEAGDLVREPVFDFTEEEIDRMVEWWELQIANEYKYGVAKLIIQLCLGLILRPFAQFIYRRWGIELMADNRKWGEHCSAAVDECILVGGHDIFLRESQQYTTPSAWAYTDQYRTV